MVGLPSLRPADKTGNSDESQCRGMHVFGGLSWVVIIAGDHG